MSKETLFLVKQSAWVVTTALCWSYSAQGYSSWPRFSVWFWGIAFWFDLIILAVAVSIKIAEQR